MAKARRIPGLSANEPYAAAAAKIVRVRVGELIDSSRGVLDISDPEHLHDMRVATRRLRAALEIFELCFPREILKAGLRDVKALADALGDRRDRDVGIAALEDITTSMSAPDRPGIETFIVRLRAEQSAANEVLARFVSPEHLASLGDQLSDLVAGAEATSRADGGAPIEAVELSQSESAADNGVPRQTEGEEG